MTAECEECGEDFPAYPWWSRTRCWRCRLVTVEGVEPPEPSCGHLEEYQTADGCLRCEQAWNTADDRAAARGAL